jgi:hypothetical protein
MQQTKYLHDQKQSAQESKDKFISQQNRDRHITGIERYKIRNVIKQEISEHEQLLHLYLQQGALHQ